MRVASIAFRVGGGENSVDKHKGTNDLCSKASALGVARAQNVGATTVPMVEALLEWLDEPNTADGSQALCDHVEKSSYQGHLAGQEKPECHRRVDVATWKGRNNYN